jgi:hypothetical protein
MDVAILVTGKTPQAERFVASWGQWEAQYIACRNHAEKQQGGEQVNDDVYKSAAHTYDKTTEGHGFSAGVAKSGFEVRRFLSINKRPVEAALVTMCLPSESANLK